MVSDAPAASAFRVLAKWLASVEVAEMNEDLSTITLSATLPRQDLFDLLKVLADAAS